MQRGDVYDADLDPVIGSEQAGYRPVVIVSRDVINENSAVVLGVPCTTYRGRRVHSTQALVHAPDGGLTVDSVALCEQVRVLSKARLGRQRGSLSAAAMDRIDRALLIALDLPGQV